MTEIIAYCGLACHTCPIYLATRQENKEEQARMRIEISQLLKGQYGMTYEPEDIADCDGCRIDDGRLFSGCENCLIRKCVREKGLENCAYCAASAARLGMVKMNKFDFLLGDWTIEYRVPKTAFSAAMAGAGTGSFKRALNDKYVYFDYSASFSTGDKAQAHAIFAWDEKAKIYRYWWFEDSGAFMTATCNFINDEKLFLNWHDTLLIQTFTKAGSNKVILRMENPNAEGKYELVLEVIFTGK